MLKNNETITFSGEKIIEVTKEIELILISLHQMGSYYGEKFFEDELKYKQEYEKETTRFIDESKITHRLAKVRAMLLESLDRELGEDEMDDIERAFENNHYWTKPGDNLSALAEEFER